MTDGVRYIRIGASLILEETLPVIHILFRSLRDAHHCLYSFHGICARRRLSGQHDRAGAVVHRIGYVSRLRSRRARVLDHGLQHLGRCDYLLTGAVNLLNDLLLDHRHFLIRNLHTHITAGYHDAIGNLYDVVNVGNALRIFNLRYDSDLLSAVFLKQFAQLQNIFFFLDKRRRNEIHILFNTE